MIRGMFDAVKEAFGDPGASTGGAKVLVLRGAGGKAFCAGGDVKAIAKELSSVLEIFFCNDGL